MLTRETLVELFQDLKDRDVLSVYLDVDEHDPAQRGAWKVRLGGEIARLRKKMEDEGDDDRAAAFEGAWRLLDDRINADGEGLATGRGLVAFATTDRLWYAGTVPSRMPDLVRWHRGIHAAPYVRALKQERPVTVVLVDGRRARMFEQVEGQISELRGIVADTDVGDLSDVGVRKGSARASGVRGETSTDQARRLLEVAATRMHKRVAELADQRAGSDGLVVVGGPPEAVRSLTSELPKRLEGRVAERPGLHLEMSAAEVREAIRDAAGDLSEAQHSARVRSVVDTARSGGRATLGAEETLKALDAKRGGALLLSRDFLHAHPGMADQLVGLAFTQDADVDEVSGDAGHLLDQEAGGVAARLRF